jgi:hypothetical protein
MRALTNLMERLRAPRLAGAVAGSVAANLLLFAVVASSLAATGPVQVRAPTLLKVTLVDVPAAELREPQPAAAVAPGRRDVTPARRRARSLADSPGEAPDDAEAIGEARPTGSASSEPAPPAGLAGLLGDDPCVATPPSRRPPHCRTGWGDRLAEVPRALARRIEKSTDAELAATVDHPDCGSKHLGCSPIPERTLIGTRPVGRSMRPGGPTGTDGLVGRLPPPNAYHVDPGFGD